MFNGGDTTYFFIHRLAFAYVLGKVLAILIPQSTLRVFSDFSDDGFPRTARGRGRRTSGSLYNCNCSRFVILAAGHEL
jgi:hypothetical protein